MKLTNNITTSIVNINIYKNTNQIITFKGELLNNSQ